MCSSGIAPASSEPIVSGSHRDLTQLEAKITCLGGSTPCLSE